ncbi:MAG: response regulator [Polyangiaceae bacterium]|nr:response regulator [Polyangiaceae bacterium]
MTKRKTILVADDDSDIRVQITIALKSAGYDVVEADGQEAAEEALLRFQPDLCVFDLMMEEMDSGFVLCHEAKRTYPDTPVILLTAVTSQTGIDFTSQTPQQRSWVKADLLLHKPVLAEQLVARVRELLATAPAVTN